MDNKGKFVNSEKFNHKIENKKRGEILYYSIDQVADLLNEGASNIKYYTNIFDDLLKIEIVDKELRYTNNDVDRLELLIKLKNRGMSLKEIQNYCNKLPLDDSEVQHTESNLISVEELIDSIKKEQQSQLNDFKNQLINDIQAANTLHLQNITSKIIEAQNKNLNEFKLGLYEEVKEHINSKFDEVTETNINLHNELLANTTEFISDKIEEKNNELKLNLQNEFNSFAQSSLTNSERLIKEVKDFKRVIESAYYTQYEVEMDNANSGFFSKLFKAVKLK